MVAEGHALKPAREARVAVRHVLVEPQPVHLFGLVVGMQDGIGKVAVVREQQHAGGLAIQAPHGKNSAGHGLEERGQVALAMRIAARQALVDQHSCFILATNELDDTLLPPQELLAGYKGQVQAERGFRFLKDPQFLASSLYLKKPERIMALLMVMTICLLVYAALEYRMRTALKEHAATFPDQKGKRIQNPTARWVFHYFVGIPVLYLPQQGPIVIASLRGGLR